MDMDMASCGYTGNSRWWDQDQRVNWCMNSAGKAASVGRFLPLQMLLSLLSSSSSFWCLVCCCLLTLSPAISLDLQRSRTEILFSMFSATLLVNPQKLRSSSSQGIPSRVTFIICSPWLYITHKALWKALTFFNTLILYLASLGIFTHHGLVRHWEFWCIFIDV